MIAPACATFNPRTNASSANPADLTHLRRRAKRRAICEIPFVPSTHFDPTAVDIISSIPNATESEAAPTREKRSSRGSQTPLALACETPLLSAADERALFMRMNSLKCRAEFLRRGIDLTRPDEAALDEIDRLLEAAGAIRNRIVAANVRLVVSIVKTYVDKYNGFDDLASDGLISLMNAVDKFDYSRGFRFSTYATRAIRRNLFRSLLVRQRERARFASGAHESTWDLADERGQGYLSESRWHSLQAALKGMLAQLDARERLIVKARFGMKKSGSVETLQSLARVLGVCKERVRQIEKRALDKLQKMASAVSLGAPGAGAVAAPADFAV